jgi:hypothetical protein
MVPGFIHWGSFLLINIAEEEYIDRAEMFSLNNFSFVFGFHVCLGTHFSLILSPCMWIVAGL